jgi:hypothetical protein
LDGGFLSSAIRRSGNGVAIHMEEVEINNEKVVLFSYTDEFEPVTLGKTEDSLTVAGIYSKFFFSVDSSVLRMLEDYYVYPNGEIELWVRKTFTTYEKVDLPPKEVLAYLNK